MNNLTTSPVAQYEDAGPSLQLYIGKGDNNHRLIMMPQSHAEIDHRNSTDRLSTSKVDKSDRSLMLQSQR